MFSTRFETIKHISFAFLFNKNDINVHMSPFQVSDTWVTLWSFSVFCAKFKFCGTSVSWTLKSTCEGAIKTYKLLKYSFHSKIGHPFHLKRPTNWNFKRFHCFAASFCPLDRFQHGKRPIKKPFHKITCQPTYSNSSTTILIVNPRK